MPGNNPDDAPAPSATCQPRLPALRYLRWRWLRFRRTWTDTRADRMPSWSRLYLRAYLHLMSLVLLMVGVPLLALACTLTPARVLAGFDALPGGCFGVALFVIVVPALAAWRWARPTWVDLVMVRERAIDFSGGRFHTRARESHSVLLGPLARMLNSLAMRMERLIAAQRDLTNGISHELRTPLARVRFALEILRDPGSEAERQDALDGIAQDVTELDELIDMSLTYARLEYSSLQSIPEPTLLASWLETEVHDLAQLDPDKTIEMRIGVPRELRVNMDTRLMSYAIRNLLRNAGKYAQSCILIGVKLGAGPGEIVIYVEDDGHGVPDSERARIFDAFVRLDRHTAGYGLGLAITRLVLEAHRGRIVVADARVLGGARFEIRWPG
ncbi:ATP-binding protein [Burkholderia sp. 22PA0099]|uniref:ATP-binding protein n=1 Tax=Burkholderia sp. 22PA0099 TaxID=3237372 RepID=UPI0039C28860